MGHSIILATSSWHSSEQTHTQKTYFKDFSWFWFYICLLRMIMCITLLHRLLCCNFSQTCHNVLFCHHKLVFATLPLSFFFFDFATKSYQQHDFSYLSTESVNSSLIKTIIVRQRYIEQTDDIMQVTFREWDKRFKWNKSWPNVTIHNKFNIFQSFKMMYHMWWLPDKQPLLKSPVSY